MGESGAWGQWRKALKAKDAASILPRKEGEFNSVDDSGSFTAYILVFGNVDRQGDLIEKNAVTNVDELITDGWIALNHDQSGKPIGYIETAEQDERGLKVTGRFHSHQEAQDVRSYVKERLDAGKKVKTSIGYLVPPDGERYEKTEGRMVRHLSKMSVYEGSIVNLPANPEAEVVSAKSLSTLDEIEEELMATDRGLVEALKASLGLSTKGGRKMSGATLEKMKGYCKAMDEHAEKCFGHAKALGESAKAMKAFGQQHKDTAVEFSKCLKDFEGGKIPTDDEGDQEEPDNDSEEKTEEPQDTADGDPPKGKARKVDEDEEGDDEAPKGKSRKEDTEEEKALKAYRESLRARSVAGRRDAVCP